MDLFILDLNMPNMGGVDTLAAIRAKPRFRKTPILFLTGQPQHAPAGVPVLAKPCGTEELLDAVRSLLSGSTRRSGASAERDAMVGLSRRSGKAARSRLQLRRREA